MSPYGTLGFEFLRKLQLLVVHVKQFLYQQHFWKEPRVGRLLLFLLLECSLS